MPSTSGKIAELIALISCDGMNMQQANKYASVKLTERTQEKTFKYNESAGVSISFDNLVQGAVKRPICSAIPVGWGHLTGGY